MKPIETEGQQVDHITYLQSINKIVVSFCEMFLLYARYFRKKLFCFRSSTQLTMKEKLYLEGKERLESELDIIQVIKKLRKLDALIKVLLSEHEQHILPFIQSNLLGASQALPKKGEEEQEGPSLNHFQSLLKQRDSLGDRILGHLLPNYDQKQIEE